MLFLLIIKKFTAYSLIKRMISVFRYSIPDADTSAFNSDGIIVNTPMVHNVLNKLMRFISIF